jgi:hypothetical protein
MIKNKKGNLKYFKIGEWDIVAYTEQKQGKKTSESGEVNDHIWPAITYLFFGPRFQMSTTDGFESNDEQRKAFLKVGSDEHRVQLVQYIQHWEDHYNESRIQVGN